MSRPLTDGELKVDTSNNFQKGFEQGQRLLGGSSIPLGEICPEAWMSVIERIYGDHRLLYAPGFFHSIGEFVGRSLPRVSPFVSHCIPHGRIKFEPGIGINTVVYLSPIHGTDQRSGEIRTEENLLLLKPEQAKPLRFALWTTRLHLNGESGPIKRTFLDSSVRTLTREDVLKIFEKNSLPASILLDIGTKLRLTAEEMMKQALDLTVLAELVLSTNRRIERK